MATCCKISFNKASIKFPRRFKSCSRRVGNLRWCVSLTIVPPESKVCCISRVNHTTNHFFITIYIIIIIVIPFSSFWVNKVTKLPHDFNKLKVLVYDSTLLYLFCCQALSHPVFELNILPQSNSIPLEIFSR